jgi:hypothetical protein
MKNRHQILDNDGLPLGSTVVPSILELTFSTPHLECDPPKRGDVCSYKNGILTLNGNENPMNLIMNIEPSTDTWGKASEGEWQVQWCRPDPEGGYQIHLCKNAYE